MRIASCNLHGPTTCAGITGLIEHVALKQYISCAESHVDNKHTNTWLEAGGFALGPISLEAAIALPNPQLHAIQDAFLRLHDMQLKRLWFLWPPEETQAAQNPAVNGKCGCLGGCQFFGMNKNGLTFFKPRKQRESSQVAIPQVCTMGHDPGFGQSLLHEGKLAFDVSQSEVGVRPSPKDSPTQFSFTRGYMSDLASPEGVEVATVRMATASSASSMVEKISGEVTFPQTPLKGMEDVALLQEHGSISTATSRPYSSHSDTQACLASSPLSANKGLKDPQSSREDQRGQSNIGSISLYVHQILDSSNILPSPVGLQSDHRGSISSGRSLEGVHTRFSSKSSLASPVSLRHALDMGSSRVNSSVSLESERYYSAEEDTTFSSEIEGPTSLCTNSTSSQEFSHPVMLTVFDNGMRDDQDGIQKIRDKALSKEVFLTLQENRTLQDRDRTLQNRDQFLDGTEESIEKAQDSFFKTPVAEGKDEDDDFATSSTTSSTLSYASAPSELDPDLDEVPEDFTLVHLHKHMNQPITQSPLLLNCYVRHLSHFLCQDWTCAGPAHSLCPSRKSLRSVHSEYSLSSASHSVYSNTSSWMPHFQKASCDFSSHTLFCVFSIR